MTHRVLETRYVLWGDSSHTRDEIELETGKDTWDVKGTITLDAFVSLDKTLLAEKGLVDRMPLPLEVDEWRWKHDL